MQGGGTAESALPRIVLFHHGTVQDVLTAALFKTSLLTSIPYVVGDWPSARAGGRDDDARGAWLRWTGRHAAVHARVPDTRAHAAHLLNHLRTRRRHRTVHAVGLASKLGSDNSKLGAGG